MKFRSEIIYQMPMSLEERYIRSFYETLDIKNFYKKEVRGMFDTTKIEEFYADLRAKRDEAIAVALLNKDAKVAERLELAKEEIAKEVEAELIAEAEKPFAHDIELCEKFLVEEVAETVADNETELAPQDITITV